MDFINRPEVVSAVQLRPDTWSEVCELAHRLHLEIRGGFLDGGGNLAMTPPPDIENPQMGAILSNPHLNQRMVKEGDWIAGTRPSRKILILTNDEFLAHYRPLDEAWAGVRDAIEPPSPKPSGEGLLKKLRDLDDDKRLSDSRFREVLRRVLDLYEKTWSKHRRCDVCGWPLASDEKDGCVPGNCSYRPAQGSTEWHRIRARRDELKREHDEFMAVAGKLLGEETA